MAMIGLTQVLLLFYDKSQKCEDYVSFQDCQSSQRGILLLKVYPKIKG